MDALLYAFTEKLPLVYTSPRKPFRFDYLDASVDLSCIKLDVEPQRLFTFDGDKKVGTPKHLLWERLLFLLGLQGQNPLSNLAHSVRYDGEGQLTFSDKYAKLIDIKFDECVYFGDDSCDQILKINLDYDKYVCYDWIAFNRGGKHQVDYIKTQDDFVQEIWFYSSDRIDGNTLVKDACAVSYLTQQELSDFNYSETMARFKVVNEMEERGMKGKFNGYGPNGKPKHYKFRTSCIGRRVDRAPQEIELESPHFRLADKSQTDMLQSLEAASANYAQILKYL